MHKCGYCGEDLDDHTFEQLQICKLKAELGGEH